MRVPTGTWVDIRPIHFIFSPVSGWKAESYSTLANHALSRENSGGSVPSLKHSTGGEEQGGKSENVSGIWASWSEVARKALPAWSYISGMERYRGLESKLPKTKLIILNLKLTHACFSLTLALIKNHVTLLYVTLCAVCPLLSSLQSLSNWHLHQSVLLYNANHQRL